MATGWRGHTAAGRARRNTPQQPDQSIEFRDVPPGGIPKPEPLPPTDDIQGPIKAAGLTAFTPGTDIDVPGGTEQQPEGVDPAQLDPNLLDPIAPGPTLDTGLVDRITQSPGLFDRVNQDPSVAEALERDPTYLYQIEQDLGLAEQWSNDDPSSFTDPSFMDPGLTEQPLPDPSTPEEGLDDLTL